MHNRYTQGGGRMGERQEQLRVREKLDALVRAGLARFGRHWSELPPGRDDWVILSPSFQN